MACGRILHPKTLPPPQVTHNPKTRPANGVCRAYIDFSPNIGWTAKYEGHFFQRDMSRRADGGHSGISFVRNGQVWVVTLTVLAVSPGHLPVTEWLFLTCRLMSTQSHSTAQYSPERLIGKQKVKKMTVRLLFNYEPRNDSYRRTDI